MPERTEEQIVFQEGIKVTLGGKEYEIKPLSLKKAREWRKKFGELMTEVSQGANVKPDETEKVAVSINTLINILPDRIIDLFFEYAPYLNKEQIENEATEQEMSKAFSEVISIAFPLARNLAQTLKSISQ